MGEFSNILNGKENKAEAQKELLHILETAEEDDKTGRVAPVEDAFTNLRKQINH